MDNKLKRAVAKTYCVARLRQVPEMSDDLYDSLEERMVTCRHIWLEAGGHREDLDNIYAHWHFGGYSLDESIKHVLKEEGDAD